MRSPCLLAPISRYASIPSCIVVAALTLHAVHADHATSYHFERSTGIYAHDTIIERRLDECVHAAERTISCFDVRARITRPFTYGTSPALYHVALRAVSAVWEVDKVQEIWFET